MYTSREREDEKTVESGALSEDMRGNFIGSWIKIEGLIFLWIKFTKELNSDNVWVHGPINTKEETIEMTLEQAETIGLIRFSFSILILVNQHQFMWMEIHSKIYSKGKVVSDFTIKSVMIYTVAGNQQCTVI